VPLPIASSVTNDQGLYDGVMFAVHQMFLWGIPYFVGRVHFRDWASARELAIGVFIAGLAYTPFCIFEMFMSPVLHERIYGVSAFGSWDVRRLGGYRPSVFMISGLEVGLLMTSASLVGVWLWWTGSLRRLMGAPMMPVVLGLLVITGLCRSLGALVLLALGLGAIFTCGTLRSAKPLLLLVIPVVLYISARATDPSAGQFLLDAAAMIEQERSDSLAVRMRMEDVLIERAMEKPLFGWGTSGGNRIRNEEGRDVTLSDSLWIIVIGMNGLVGLASVYTVLVTPIVLTAWRFRWAVWRDPLGGPACVLALMTGLFTIDCLFNALINPIYVVAAGAVVSVATARPAPRRAISPRSPPPAPMMSPAPRG